MKVILKTKNENKIIKEIKKGNPWIYASDVDKIIGEVIKGGIVKVYDSNNNYLATGYLNISSKILVRILSLIDEEINDEFWYKRILDAYNLRKDLHKEETTRLIFSEADYLPGLVVDKYGDYLVIQSTTAGIDFAMDSIIIALKKIINPKGIYIRNDVKIREKEGLELYKEWIGSAQNPIIQIKENDILLEIDIENGQKTGYFLDQQENRKLLGDFSNGKTVLDCFSNSGGFALNALKNNAKFVTAVDISNLACEQIKKNATLNNFKNLEVVTADIMEYLPKLINENKQFDIVVLDPPAFTKTKDSVNQAYNGYKKINRLAMNLVKKGGYLFTFSCSRYMTKELFKEMLNDARQERKIQIIEERFQAKDHPMLFESDNSTYLKCFILRIL